MKMERKENVNDKEWKNVRINKRNVKCWISRVILGSLTHAGMPAEASTVSIKPSVFGESLKIKDHGTLM
jgi:hypothetical protein